MAENQGCWTWGVAPDGTPDPPAVISFGDGWDTCADSFSTYVYALLFDASPLGPGVGAGVAGGGPGGRAAGGGPPRPPAGGRGAAAPPGPPAGPPGGGRGGLQGHAGGGRGGLPLAPPAYPVARVGP